MMVKPSVQELLKKVDNRYRLVVVVSKRDDEYCYDLTAKLYEKYGESIFDNIFNEMQ